MLKEKIIRVRWMKPYPTAHNHVAIGLVIAETNNYLVLNCKTYHFGANIGGRKVILRNDKYVGGVLVGENAIRVIPWHCIEVINELPPSTDWTADACVDESGLCFLNNEHKTVITRAPERNI